jgi:hypothetical protein
MNKVKWIKRFKYFAKSVGIKKREVIFWAEYCWRENTSDTCQSLSAKDSAIELKQWMSK